MGPASDSPLDALGRQLAEILQGQFAPHLLFKIRQTEKLSLLRRPDREQTLAGVYEFSTSPVPVRHILVIDDVLTSGTTMRAITAAIRAKLPGTPVTLFTLASTDYAADNEKLELEAEHYQWANNSKWIARDIEAVYSVSYDLVVWCIENDDFSLLRV